MTIEPEIFKTKRELEKKDMKDEITEKKLKKILNYNPKTGLFSRLVTRGGHVAGSIVGTKRPDGYVDITINGTAYKAHRLAWLWMEGYHPEHDIDHKDGARDNNKWVNLRHVTRSCNFQNRTTDKRNRSGFPGVTYHAGQRKWHCNIGLNGKNIYLGFYDDPLEAALVRFTVENQCLHWACNHRSELAKAIKKAWPGFSPKQ